MKRRVCLILTLLALLCLFCAIWASNVSGTDATPYYEADSKTIEKYTNEAMELVKKITNSPTEVTWTGTAYYISENGNDSNDGLTPTTAWKSPLKVSEADFLKPGDAVLFERGGIYRYEGTITTVKGVTYSAYGSGKKPRLIGSYDASYEGAWKESEYENVYYFDKRIVGVHYDVGQIVFDLGKAWGIKVQDHVVIGVASNGLETLDHGTPSISNPGDLKNDLQFWHEYDSGYVYLYSKYGNPTDRFDSIEVVDRGNAIGGKGTDVVIDNLEFFGFGSHGIGYGQTENLLVQNCIFGFIGGSRIRTTDDLGRFGNAVEIFGNGNGYTVRNNFAHNVYDCCWTIQFQGDPGENGKHFKNVEFANNVSMFSNTGPEIWLVNNDGNHPDAPSSMENVRVHHNYNLYSGYGWSQQRPVKDANFFFGGERDVGSKKEFINCSVDNNVVLFSTKWLSYLRYLGPDYHNFNNNVYFQHNDKLYGGIPTDPENALGKLVEYKYDLETVSNLLESGIEAGSTFYYVNSDYEIAQYSPEILNFEDINNHWARRNIQATIMRGYMNGISSFEFAPNASMTRSMLTKVLMRLYYDDEVFTEAPLSDVNQSSWYSSSVNWAYKLGIIDNKLTKFRPDEPITREEIADMLYRLTYSRFKCESYEGKALDFTDASSVSPEYAAGVAFAIENGIISGYTDGHVMPRNTATRAEVVTMINRYYDLYHQLETDYSRLTSDNTTSVVFDANELSGFVKATNGSFYVENPQTEAPVLVLNPIYGSGNFPKLVINESTADINLCDYPYVRFHIKRTGKSKLYNVKLDKSNASKDGVYNFDSSVYGYNSYIFCVYDMFKPTEISNSSKELSLTLSPWHTGDAPVYGVDTAEIEYIGFFPSLEMAQNYEGVFEKNGVKVRFIFDGKVVEEEYLLSQSKFEYPDISLSKPGYTFKGWSIAEGTLITTDTDVFAVFEKASAQPVAVYNTDNMIVTAGTGLVSSYENENTKSYVRFSVTEDGKSVDGTSATIGLTNLEFDIKKAPVAKVLMRTNIASSDVIDLNVAIASNCRLWGPKPAYEIKSEWFELTLDFASLNYTGGSNVDKGLTAKEYYEKYLSGSLYSLMFKPYKSANTAMKKGEYLDIQSIAFFANEEDANAYSFGMPALLLDSNKLTALENDKFTAQTLSEFCNSFIRHTVKADGKSNQNTRITLGLDKTYRGIEKAPFVKLMLRTNIASADKLSFGLGSSTGSEITGTSIEYGQKGQWYEYVLDLSDADSIEASSILISPYYANEIDMKAEEYIDIMSIAFFKSKKDAIDFTYTSVPTAAFTVDGITPVASADFTLSTENENGKRFYRFYVSESGKSLDSTRATAVLDNASFKVKDAHIVKLAIRTNIASSSAIDFNIYVAQKTRIWGPKPEYTRKGGWMELTLDLSALNYTGGEGVEKGLSPNQYYEKYFTNSIYSFMFKPYYQTGRAMVKGEYFDVLGIAFFESLEEAEKFSFIK